MGRILLGVILAAVAAFFWGFLYFGASGVPYQSWKSPADHDAASKVLLEHFPERGIYSVPAVDNDPEVVNAQTEAGPVARVYMLRPGGRPLMVPSMMAIGWVHEALLAVGLTLLLLAAGGALPTYARRVRFVALVGLVSAFTSHIGAAVWWETPSTWSLVLAFHEFGMFVVMGLVLCKFVGGKSSKQEESAQAAAV